MRSTVLLLSRTFPVNRKSSMVTIFQGWRRERVLRRVLIPVLSQAVKKLFSFSCYSIVFLLSVSIDFLPLSLFCFAFQVAFLGRIPYVKSFVKGMNQLMKSKRVSGKKLNPVPILFCDKLVVIKPCSCTKASKTTETRKYMPTEPDCIPQLSCSRCPQNGLEPA